jgi:hypothetical protein
MYIETQYLISVKSEHIFTYQTQKVMASAPCNKSNETE